MNSRTLANAVCLFSLAACVAPMGSWPATGSPSSPYGIASIPSSPVLSDGTAMAQPADYPLYSRDGGVVEAREPGSVVEGTPSHDVQPTPSGRMYILELYQAAIDARDSLQLEVAALSSALDRAQEAIDKLEKQKQLAESSVVTLSVERDRLIEENAELTARVVTAQIRRLEAEKVLLESKLEWLRDTEAEPEEPPTGLESQDSMPASEPAAPVEANPTVEDSQK